MLLLTTGPRTLAGEKPFSANKKNSDFFDNLLIKGLKKLSRKIDLNRNGKVDPQEKERYHQYLLDPLTVHSFTDSTKKVILKQFDAILTQRRLARFQKTRVYDLRYLHSYSKLNEIMRSPKVPRTASTKGSLQSL